MTTLLALWLLSLAILIGMVVYAHRKDDRSRPASQDAPVSFADFIAIELTRMTGHLVRGAFHLRPHGERVIAESRVFIRRGHDVFIEKIFGRLDVEQGQVTSFFLKRIAEHKEALRGKKRGKM